MRIAGIRFSRCICRFTILRHFVGVRGPLIPGIVDNFFRNLLPDYPFHHPVNHLLLFVSGFPVGIVRLDLVAQVPVREKHHIIRKKLPSVVGAKLSHMNIVFSNIHIGVPQCSVSLLIQFRRNA